MVKRKGKSVSRATSKKPNGAGYLSPGINDVDLPDYVIAELKYESPVAFSASGFQAPRGFESHSDPLNELLGNFDIASIDSHFGIKPNAIKNRVAVASGLPPAPSPDKFVKKGMDTSFVQSGFVQIVPKNSADAGKIARELSKADSIWKAIVAPRPVPCGNSGSGIGSRLFEPSQGYLCSAPNGVGAYDIWNQPGAKGDGITICDIEGNWNLDHEDLPKGIKLIGGSVIDEVGWRNHGTAVLGEMVSVPNDIGTVGISHKASAVVQSTVINGVFNTAGAISNAASKLGPGDVLLIELQATGPNNKYVAMQYWSDIFSAIVAATAKGITVVEAAGNGDENFDLPVFNNTGLQKDSGAIVVGAGVPPTNYFGYPGYQPIGTPRSRIWFSNYGKIVNLQGWGYHVSSTGYGDAQGGTTENNWYTLTFSGTSSASPIVTGCVACLQGLSKKKHGTPLPPSKIRQVLMQTGTPQQPGPNVPITQQIGPQPDLLRAAAAILKMKPK